MSGTCSPCYGALFICYWSSLSPSLSLHRLCFTAEAVLVVNWLADRKKMTNQVIDFSSQAEARLLLLFPWFWFLLKIKLVCVEQHPLYTWINHFNCTKCYWHEFIITKKWLIMLLMCFRSWGERRTRAMLPSWPGNRSHTHKHTVRHPDVWTGHMCVFLFSVLNSHLNYSLNI